MIKFKRAILILLIVTACVGCDQMTKSIAKSYLLAHPSMSFLGDTFRVQYAENDGAFLSLGASLPPKTRMFIFIGGVSLFLISAFIYLIFASGIDALAVMSLSLVIGGGLSNLLDRIFYSGHVVDFLNLGLGGLRTGIFNVADLAIMLGMFLLVLGSIKSSGHKKLKPD
jgi:signal peptidase II